MILGLDPGTTKSAYVLFDPTTQKISSLAIEQNESLIKMLRIPNKLVRVFAMETMACFGFVIGQEVMETIRWEGRFMEAMRHQHVTIFPVKRKQVVTHHTGNAKGGDSAVRAAMRTRFGKEMVAECVRDLTSALAIAAYASDHSTFPVTRSESSGALVADAPKRDALNFFDAGPVPIGGTGLHGIKCTCIEKVFPCMFHFRDNEVSAT